MTTAVQRIRPKVMVLLETEIWPGLLSALKQNRTRILIINGRLSASSVRAYRLLKALWRHRRPDLILAVSLADARRFSRIFGPHGIGVMPNIKFDRLQIATDAADNSLRSMLPETAPFLVLGSIRQEEEKSVENIISEIYRAAPQTVTGIFPRHMHRIGHWVETLGRMNMPWMLRSDMNGRTVKPGTLILWDTFGELNHAYGMARAVFVGGSLAPLGGQNFLEPLVCGVRPVIGPYWDHFAWVGEDIIRQGLVIKVGNQQSAVSELMERLRRPEPRGPVREAALKYIHERSGGTRQACDAILSALRAG
jgi:3-deoxy-D-manno-octulosonic-acid transferase